MSGSRAPIEAQEPVVVDVWYASRARPIRYCLRRPGDLDRIKLAYVRQVRLIRAPGEAYCAALVLNLEASWREFIQNLCDRSSTR